VPESYFPQGEFNIVIAGLAVTAGTDSRLGSLAAAYVLILAIAGPLLARTEEPFARLVTDDTPRSVPDGSLRLALTYLNMKKSADWETMTGLVPTPSRPPWPSAGPPARQRARPVVLGCAPQLVLPTRDS
jgi:hypothetical protein